MAIGINRRSLFHLAGAAALLRGRLVGAQQIQPTAQPAVPPAPRRNNGSNSEPFPTSTERSTVAIAHGEGLPQFADEAMLRQCVDGGLIAVRYLDNRGQPAQRYPANPNGAVHAIAALTSSDGRATITMPHPERVYRTVQNSWHPRAAGEDSGWMRLFRNARVWLG